MADQAQGLRALADQSRRDQNAPSLHLAPSSADLKVAPGGAAHAVGLPAAFPAETGEVRSAVTTEPLTTPAFDVAAVDQRLYPSAPSSASASSLTGEGKPSRRARVVAITSGKGGVGKTNFCSNLALTLAARGSRVIVVDADLGLANVHVVLGVAPKFHLEHVMRGEKTLAEVLYTGPNGVSIIGGGSGLMDMANLDEQRRALFVRSLSQLDSLADIVLIDTGAGLSRNVMAFLCAVEEIIVVTTPEPTAITDAYATIKVVSQENPEARQRLVINMAHSEAEARAVEARLRYIARRFLDRELETIGFIPSDPLVARAVRSQKPFVLTSPQAPAACAIAHIATALGYDRPPASSLDARGMTGLLSRMQRYFGVRSS